MHIIGCTLALALMAPPTQLTDGSVEVFNPQLHSKRSEVSWESLQRGNRTVQKKHLKTLKTTAVESGNKPVRNLHTQGGRTVINVLTESGRWALFIGKRETVSPSAASDVHGALSPNGKKLALISGRTGNGDLYLANARKHRQSPRRLTHTTETEVHPIWSPDGSTIAVIRGHVHGRKLITLSGVDSKEGPIVERVVAEITDNPLSASFSPTGKYIGFYGREWGVGTALYVAQPTGGVRKLLDNIVPQQSGPAWVRQSPKGDGWMIVVTDNDELVAVHPTMGVKTLPVDTFGHGEIAAATIKGMPLIVFTALGRKGKRQKIRNRKLFRWIWPRSASK